MQFIIEKKAIQGSTEKVFDHHRGNMLRWRLFCKRNMRDGKQCQVSSHVEESWCSRGLGGLPLWLAFIHAYTPPFMPGQWGHGLDLSHWIGFRGCLFVKKNVGKVQFVGQVGLPWASYENNRQVYSLSRWTEYDAMEFEVWARLGGVFRMITVNNRMIVHSSGYRLGIVQSKNSCFLSPNRPCHEANNNKKLTLGHRQCHWECFSWKSWWLPSGTQCAERVGVSFLWAGLWTLVMLFKWRGRPFVTDITSQSSSGGLLYVSSELVIFFIFLSTRYIVKKTVWTD